MSYLHNNSLYFLIIISSATKHCSSNKNKHIVTKPNNKDDNVAKSNRL